MNYCFRRLFFFTELAVGDRFTRGLAAACVYLDIAIFASLGVDYLNAVEAEDGIYDCGHDVQSVRIASCVFPLV